MSFDFPVYVVDDDAGVREWVCLVLEARDVRCRGFYDGAEFVDALDGLEPGCILLDMRMPRCGGLQVQAELARRESRMPVIAMTGYGDVAVAVEAMKRGAIDLLEKPIETELLIEALEAGAVRLKARGS